MNKLKIILILLSCFNCITQGMGLGGSLTHIIQTAESAVSGYNASLRAAENAIDAHERIGTQHTVDHQSFSNSQILNTINSDNMGINLNSPIDFLAHQIQNEQSSFVAACTETQTSSLTTIIDITRAQDISVEVESKSNDLHTDANVTPSMQATEIAISNSSLTHQEHTGDTRAFSDLTSFDSKHAIEHYQSSHSSEQVGNNYTNSNFQFRTHSLEQPVRYRVGENISETEFLNSILSKSNSLNATSAQLSVCTKDWSSSSTFKISEKTQQELRSFFFEHDYNQGIHFIPVDTSERQGQLIKILNTDIQKYYESIGDHQGYIDFLNNYAQKDIEQARYLHGIAKDGKDVIDHIESFSEKTASYLYSFIKNAPANCIKITYSLFAQDLRKIENLCKHGKIAEAEAYINTRLQQSLSGGDHPITVSCRTMSLRDHNNLCKVFDNYKRKLEQTTQHSLNQNALVSVVTQKAENQELRDKIQNKNEAPPQNNQVQKSLDVQTIETQVSSPPAPTGPENDKLKNQKSFGEVLLSDREYQETFQKLDKLKKETSDIKVQDHESNINDMNHWQKIRKESSSEYNNIRADLNDVDKVSENLGIDKNIVQKVKDHVFYNKHQLDRGLDRFNSDLNIAEAWKRISDNKYVRSDLEWFLHEFAESKIEAAFPEISHRSAHDYVNSIHNWSTLLSK